MINLNRLKPSPVQDTANAEKATKELDRMIAIHTRKAEELKERIKRYLLKHSQHEGEPWYQGNAHSIGCEYATQVVTAGLLTELKQELEKGDDEQ